MATFVGYFIHSLLEVSYYDYKVLLLFWLLVGTVALLPDLMKQRAKVLIGTAESAIPAEDKAG
jgi:hypothetical protein